MCIPLIAFSTTILLDQESLKHTDALYLRTLIYYYSSDDNTKSRNVASPLFKYLKLGHHSKWQVCTLLFFPRLLNGDTSPLSKPAFMRTGTNL